MTKKDEKTKTHSDQSPGKDAGILKKLLHIQREVDSLVKDKTGHNYSYPSGNQILNKIRPLMNELGLLLKQEVTGKRHEVITYINSYGDEKSEMFCDTEQLFTWIDTDTGTEYPVRWSADGMNGWDKGLGSALTYGERYFLLKFFHVPTDADDPDTNQEDKSGASSHAGGGGGTRKPDEEKEWLNRTEYKSDKLTDEWLDVANLVYGEPKKLRAVYADWKVNKKCRAELQKLANKEVPPPPEPRMNTKDRLTKGQLSDIEQLAEYLAPKRKAVLAAKLKQGFTSEDADNVIAVLKKNRDIRLQIDNLRENGYDIPETYDAALADAGSPAEYVKIEKQLNEKVGQIEDELGA